MSEAQETFAAASPSASGPGVGDGVGSEGGVESVAQPGRAPLVRPLQIIGVPGVVCEGDVCELPAGP